MTAACCRFRARLGSCSRRGTRTVIARCISPSRDAVIAGDAVVTLDPYTGRRGPRIVAAAATVDTRRNLDALDAIAQTGAGTVLVGHGEPWRQGAAAIVEQARAAGPA